MKIQQTILAAIAMVSTICCQPATIHAATTVSPANSFAYGANVGWLNWAGDTNNGAVVGGYVCSGYIYSANVGWINLGSGAPTNGAAYQNLSANDFGVNMDSAGNLRGYAYAANVGWINFEATGAPTLNLTTGALSGYAWGANIGWISLSNAYAYVQTTLPVTPPSGMVAWWPANGNAVDVVGGNNGTLTNGAAYVPGEVQQAFNFNANSAMVLIANNPDLQLQNFTIEAWIQRANPTNATSDPSPQGEGSGLLFGYGNNGYGFGVESSTPSNPYGDKLVLTKVGVGGVLSSAPVSDTNWHHVAVTVTNGTVTFYIDGIGYPVSGNYNPGYTFATAPSIGGMASKINQPGNNSFLGSIDELAVYSNALSAVQILSIYQAGAAGKNVGYYLNPPPSSVGITRSGSSLTIAWPNTGSYIVQQNTNLAVAAGWVTVTNSVATSNGTNSITLVPPLAGNLFFRLKH